MERFVFEVPVSARCRGSRRTLFRTARWLALACVLAAPLATPGVAGAQTMTGPVNVNQIRTGWNADSFAVVTVQAITNPAKCPIADGYISTKPAKGYGTFFDAAKLAFQLNARVQVAIDNSACVSGRPKIIGINVLR
jgi:hypothetical protein